MPSLHMIVLDHGIEPRVFRTSDGRSATEPVEEMVRAAGIEPAIFHLSGGCSATEPGTEMMNDRYGVVKDRCEKAKTKAAPGRIPGAAAKVWFELVYSTRSPRPQWPPMHLEIPGDWLDRAAE